MSYYVVHDELYHHGILGQKWGVRRYQNSDGSLTAQGKKRYHASSVKEMGKDDKRIYRSDKKIAKTLYKANESYKRSNDPFDKHDTYVEKSLAERRYRNAEKIFNKSNPNTKFKASDYNSEVVKNRKTSGEHFVEKTKKERAADITKSVAARVGASAVLSCVTFPLTGFVVVPVVPVSTKASSKYKKSEYRTTLEDVISDDYRSWGNNEDSRPTESQMKQYEKEAKRLIKTK